MNSNMSCDHLIVVSLEHSAMAAVRALIAVSRLCSSVAECLCQMYTPALHLAGMREGRLNMIIE